MVGGEIPWWRDDRIPVLQYHFDKISFHFHSPTVQFKTTSLPAMSLSRKYSPSPTGTTRSVPISFSHNMVIVHYVITLKFPV